MLGPPLDDGTPDELAPDDAPPFDEAPSAGGDESSELHDTQSSDTAPSKRRSILTESSLPRFRPSHIAPRSPGASQHRARVVVEIEPTEARALARHGCARTRLSLDPWTVTRVEVTLRGMKKDGVTFTRKEFLRAFAGLVAYAAPAVLVLDQLGCSSGSGTSGTLGDGGTANDPYCSYQYDDAGAFTSASCSYPDGGSCSISPPATSCS